jgi:1-acyl-sn-glycerol-3-phosphate acyltransferase
VAVPRGGRDSDRPRDEDPALLAKAFDDIERALRNGEVVCVFPEGKLTRDGEVGEFRRGVDEILARTPVPVVPMALRGMWGSFYSRASGEPMSGGFRGFRSAVQLVCGKALAPARAKASMLRERVTALRGAVR